MFSKKSIIPKNNVLIWYIVLGDKNWHLGASFKPILFLENLKFEKCFSEIWIFKKKQCFLAFKMTLKAHSELKCHNILILSRMVLNYSNSPPPTSCVYNEFNILRCLFRTGEKKSAMETTFFLNSRKSSNFTLKSLTNILWTPDVIKIYVQVNYLYKFGAIFDYLEVYLDSMQYWATLNTLNNFW